MANEKRLVDYIEIRKLFDEEYKRKMQLVRNGETHLDNMAEGFTGADKVIFMLPRVDAVEVIRCKDCKHFGGVIRAYTCRLHSTGNTRIQMHEDDYCSRGERKDDASGR